MPTWTSSQQRAIQVRGHNVIVSAGAGSGKTAVLTERVFELLKEGTALDEILVLTFTNAAASEMRDRIRKKLADNPQTREIASRIDASDICTFDAYALSLVKKYHYLLGLGNRVSILDENVMKIKKRKIVDDIFSEYYDSEDPRFIQMIGMYALREDEPIKDFVLKVDSMINLKIDKKNFLKTYLETFYQEEKVNQDILKFQAFICEIAQTVQKGTTRFENPTMGDKIFRGLNDIVNASHYDEFQELLANFKFPRASGLSDEDALLHKSLKKQCDKFKHYAALGKRSEILSRFMSTKESVGVLLAIIEKMNERLDLFKKTYEVFTFSDIASMALTLVKKTPVGIEIKNKLKFIMIDEYQDTNDLQEEFVSSIANENVYMVGDVKQSIYRFRNANSDIFAQKYLNYRSGSLGEAIDLNENFRSRKEIIEDINGVFSKLMSLDFGGAAYLESHIIKPGNKDYDVLGASNKDHHFEVFQYEKPEAEDKNSYEARLVAEDILAKIAQKYTVFDKDLKRLRDSEFKDFAILIDRKSKFEIYQKIFAEYGIPLNAEKDSGLSDSDVIMTFQNLIRLYDLELNQRVDENYRHAYFSVARSFLCQYSDQEIFDIDQGKNYSKTPIISKIKQVIQDKKSFPLSEILSSLIDAFDFFEKLVRIGNVEENRRKIQGLIDISASLEQIGYGLKEFIEYFDDLANFDVALSVPSSKTIDNCVRLMSIHKSKGLEFPIIYYTGMTNRFNEESFASSFLTDSTFGIILPVIDQLEANNIYHYLTKQKEHRAMLSEEVRLLYVALTRAKEKMIVLLPENEIEKPDVFNLDGSSSFHDFFRHVGLDPARIKKVSTQGVTSKENIKKAADLQLFLKKNELSYSLIQRRRASKQTQGKPDPKALDFGTRIHALLEAVDFKTKTVDFIHNPTEQRIILKVVNLPIFEHLHECHIFKEYQFFDADKNTRGIIDLLLVFPTHVMIVDYKLKNLEDEAYNEQLQAYANYVKKVFDKPTDCYLLSILTGDIKKVDVL